MRSEWDQPALVEPWAAAMGEHGDQWRQALINPVVLAACEAAARRIDPFRASVFAPILQRLRERAPAAPARLEGTLVVDLGCGEGCLGRLLSGRGGGYLGVDGSEALLAIARSRADPAGRMRFAAIDLEASDGSGPARLPTLLAAGEIPALVTAVVVLDHMAEVSSFLGWLAAWLADQPGEVPVLCVTLAPERFELGDASLHRPAEYDARRVAVVESCQREVTVWLRARRSYERAFRDAGLFVRRCEPLFFHRLDHQAPPDQRDDVSRRPVFWAWLLSARRRDQPAAPVSWPEGSDAAALRASALALGPGQPQPRVHHFPPGEAVVRVHNMGGELFAVLGGAAKMMDGDQELMTFRPGEVLGDLETPDASGQCGSFPFDVVAGAEGCQVALFPESTAQAVLAGSREIGSRLFRLLRDRLRLALWHYDIREMIGEYMEVGTERLEKRLLHRCARALLWAAAIESRGRTIGLRQELAFIDPETIARRFKPGTERIDFGVVIRQLHLLRLIDAFPGAALRKEEEARAALSWDALVGLATTRFLLRPEESAGGGGGEPRVAAAARAHAGRLRVSGQLIKDGNRTRQFQDVVEDLAFLTPAPGDWRARLDAWSAYIARAHRFWEDRNPWLVVLRDVPGLRALAVGNAQSIELALGARAESFLGDGRRPTWELTTAQTSSARRQEYIAVLDEFLAADLRCGGGLAFSSESGG